MTTFRDYYYSCQLAEVRDVPVTKVNAKRYLQETTERRYKSYVRTVKDILEQIGPNLWPDYSAEASNTEGFTDLRSLQKNGTSFMGQIFQERFLALKNTPEQNKLTEPYQGVQDATKDMFTACKPLIWNYNSDEDTIIPGFPDWTGPTRRGRWDTIEMFRNKLDLVNFMSDIVSGPINQPQ